jgi:WXG100 family type VII secretion target
VAHSIEGEQPVSTPSGGGNKVHVEHGALQAQASRLTQARADLEHQLQQIQSQITELVSNGFVTDSASGSFAAAHERWNTAAANCVSELDLMGQYLQKTSQAFADVDQQFTVKL